MFSGQRGDFRGDMVLESLAEDRFVSHTSPKLGVRGHDLYQKGL